MHSSSVIGFVVLLLCGIQIQAKAGSRSSTKYLTEDYLDSQDFVKSVMRNVQILQRVDVDCKDKNGLYSYYGITNRCENCSSYCSNPLPDMKKRCIEKCEAFLINQLTSNRLTTMEDRIMEMMTSQTWNNNCLYVWLSVLTGINVVLVLAFLIGLHVFYRFFLKPRFEPRRGTRSPESDSQTEEFIGQSNNRRDEDIGYSSSQSSQSFVANET